jgi:DNA modification methylase
MERTCNCRGCGKTFTAEPVGSHRLLCGDATKDEDVARLMAGSKADMMFTDPPYGVDYEGGHFHSGDVDIVRKREKLKADESASIYAQFLSAVLPVVDGPCYVWFAHSRAYEVFKAFRDNSCTVSAVLVWHKTNATYAAMNSQYKQRHEPCAYFKRAGTTLRWTGAATESTLWEESRDPKNTLHPTQKPVCLAFRAIRNHDVATVLDVFAGSGSTVIAAEQAGKLALALEIDPGYCDVIVARWEKLTGKTATLEPHA